MSGIFRMIVKKHFSTSQGRLMSAGHEAAAAAGMKLWKNVTIFVGLPAVALCMVNSYLVTQEEELQDRPEFVAYEYMRVRTKRFPWGDGNHTLFHNPHFNALPTGYEADQHH